MNTKIVYSTKETVTDIVADIKKQLNGFDIELMQFFASSNINSEELSQKLYDELGQKAIFGCTTCGEIVPGQMLENSVVLMAMNKNVVDDYKIEVLENISTDEKVVDKAFKSFSNHFGEHANKLDPEKHIGFVLIDGLSLKEEAINERIGDLTNVDFVGASAGDDLKYEKTYVFANGKTYSDAAVLCLLKPKVKFKVLKTQNVSSLCKKLKVTKVDEPTRTIIEFNNKPALEEYTKLTGYTKDDEMMTFAQHPLGIVFSNDDIFVRSPHYSTEGSKIVFACSVREGMELDLLQTEDILAKTKKDLDKAIAQMGKPTALINYNCMLRTMQLKRLNKEQEYMNVFDGIPTIGFTTYGESYIGHLNQTSVMLLIGDE